MGESINRINESDNLATGRCKVVVVGLVCHVGEHAEWVPRSNIATTNGFFSGTWPVIGAENRAVVIARAAI